VESQPAALEEEALDVATADLEVAQTARVVRIELGAASRMGE